MFQHSVHFPATVSGLVNMGYSASSSVNWITTDTYQLITHEVMPSSDALTCASCHDSTSRMNLQGELGFTLKGSKVFVCTQCYENEDEERPGYKWIHDKHVDDKRYTCSWYHNFSRPERTNLR